MRTDNNNNPTAFTVDIAHEAGLQLGVDYTPGDIFPSPSSLVTARLIGDPIAITIRVIDRIGYFTRAGKPRWDYIAIPRFTWGVLSLAQKCDVIGFHYMREGGTEMRKLFRLYGQL